MCVCSHMYLSTNESHQKVSDQLQMDVRHLTWVLGTELYEMSMYQGTTFASPIKCFKEQLC